MVSIERVTGRNLEAAVDLLARFFVEEGFPTGRPQIASNLGMMLEATACWAAIAVDDGRAVGVVTVTTMLYVEWGRLGEIGDLYVVPERRGRGLAKRLVAEAVEWCRREGCAAVSVVVTPDGDRRHHLSQFYQRLRFTSSGRTIMTRTIDRA